MIFNSLGSNYNWQTVCQIKDSRGKFNAIKIDSDDKKRSWGRERLQKWLEAEYKNEVRVNLFYKAREALTVGWRVSGLSLGDLVAINGWTCYVVEDSLRRAGLKPVFLDVKSGEMNFGIAELKTAWRKSKEQLKAVVLQNSLGWQMSEVEEVVEFCRRKRIMVVEDMAHNFGAEYELAGNRTAKVGELGDWGVISFSQDKGCDVVSGGALVVRDKKMQSNLAELEKKEKWQEVSKRQKRKDLSYPLKTWIIRKNYDWGGGKVFHWLWKKTQSLSNPMTYLGDEKINLMSNELAEVAVEKLEEGEWSKDWERRRRLAMTYREELRPELLLPQLSQKKKWQGPCLRFPILVPMGKRKELVEFLAKKRIFISDIWYDSVIAPKKYRRLSLYRAGECRMGEKLAEEVLNLPTHQEVSEKQAVEIAQLINNYLEE